MRLTTKGLINDVKTNDIPYLERYRKLSQLEDIEEELGIDLITLFKALKNGIYVKGYKGNIDFIKKPFLRTDIEPFFLDYMYNEAPLVTCYPLKLTDYGKTWALTEEELTNGENA